jgi:hypothetical protein
MAQKTPQGGGNHGYLALLMSPEAYLALTQVAFDIPAYPGADPVHAPGATGPQITEANRAHLSNLTQYNAYKDTENKLKEMLIAAVPSTFIQILEHQLFGYSQLFPLQILAHLDTPLGEVTNEALANNLDQMNKPWDPTKPIENLWAQIQKAKNYAAANHLYPPDFIGSVMLGNIRL